MDNTRNRAWRKFKNRINKSRDQKHHSGLYDFSPEKRWKMLYTRGDKLIRATQLGIDYPRVSQAMLTRNARYEESDQ
ncbi:hypothetical protein [Morganella psychrotolerans]|uniref:Uncharacterized protein n=1 Tax=Morganella psychrotolerans TaxID=368603 RepID=A0A1B8HAA2_9GAMM|nr:hypothetical protein [Morganella psychrotolerans]OBU05970.1 hypothetical protein AYY17_06465 [Morganella psychrotolerans]